VVLAGVEVPPRLPPRPEQIPAKLKERNREISLIFDTFSSMERAQAFVAKVQERFGLAGQVFDNSDDTDQQEPIVVHIDRAEIEDGIKVDTVTPDPTLLAKWTRDFGAKTAQSMAIEFAVERAVEEMVGEFDGTFIGT